MGGMGMSIKHLAIFTGLGFLAFMYGSGTGNYWWFAGWAIASGVGYVGSLYLHPRRNCWHCKGTGRHQGMIFDYGRRPCEHCAPNGGWRLRWGARHLNIHPDGWPNRR